MVSRSLLLASLVAALLLARNDEAASTQAGASATVLSMGVVGVSATAASGQLSVYGGTGNSFSVSSPGSPGAHSLPSSGSTTLALPPTRGAPLPVMVDYN
ncbi:hypothetical protein [Massilia sp. TS11]|uniref:hypothetical protein n=1 Tax=Massilia sp. TS11 TaxID=2908003 RepID=UPI001EDA6BBB|nr:hypothetical protein [Massilia sp. TS11]MCG2586469.1 hypothetical protein [Massilia sp. TS11]